MLWASFYHIEYKLAQDHANYSYLLMSCTQTAMNLITQMLINFIYYVISFKIFEMIIN